MTNPKIKIILTDGREINAELYPEVAPKTVSNFLKLVNEKFYDGIIFKIGNYKRINYISSKLIEICFSNYLIKLKGEMMKILSLDDSEFYIQGRIVNIEMIYNV